MIINLDKIAWFQEGPGVRNYQYKTTGTKLINVSNLGQINLNLSNTSRYISNEEANGKYKHFLCDAGDLVIASSGINEDSISQKVSFVRDTDLPLCMNTSVIRFKCLNEKELNIKYLYYFFKSNSYKKQILKLMTGIAQLNFGPSHLHKVTINYVNRVKQENIIKRLDLLSNLIATQEKQLKLLDELIKSRFVEMFGDVFNGKSNYSTIKISDVVSHKIERASKDFLAEDEIQYVDISSIDNSKNIIIGYTNYRKKDAPSRAQQHVKKDDIVISTVRPNLNNVARIQDDYKNIVASSGFCVLRAEKVESDYLFGLVSMQAFANYLASLTTGASYPAVSDKDILNFEIPNAPKNKQIEYAEFIRRIDKSKFNYYSRYFLCDILTLFSSTIAYSSVVSILA